MSGPRFDDTRVSIPEMLANIEHQIAQLEDANTTILEATMEIKRLQEENRSLRRLNNELMAQIAELGDEDFKNEDYSQ